MGAVSHSRKASWALDGEQRGKLKALGLGGFFLLVSLLVGREAKEDDLGRHGASPGWSGEGLRAASSGWTRLFQPMKSANSALASHSISFGRYYLLRSYAPDSMRPDQRLPDRSQKDLHGNETQYGEGSREGWTEEGPFKLAFEE